MTTINLKPNYQIYSCIGRPRNLFTDPVAHILNIVSECTNAPILSISTVGRGGTVIFAKHIARYMIYYYTIKNLRMTAFETGASDHSTTINSITVCGDLNATDPSFRHLFNKVEARVSRMYTKPKKRVIKK